MRLAHTYLFHSHLENLQKLPMDTVLEQVCICRAGTATCDDDDDGDASPKATPTKLLFYIFLLMRGIMIMMIHFIDPSFPH